METGFEPPALPPIMEGGQYGFGGGDGGGIGNGNNGNSNPGGALPTATADHHNIPPSHHQTINPDNNQVSLSRRQRARRGILSKVDSVYGSVHALEILANLIKDACSYIETVSHESSGKKSKSKHKAKAKKRGVNGGEGEDKRNSNMLDLPCECLRLIIDELDQHASIISQAIVNSSDTKEVMYAQRKLMKRQKQNYAQWGDNHKSIMERDPKNALTHAMAYARETLGDILSKTDPDFIDPVRAKKRKRSLEQEQEQPPANAAAASENAGNAEKMVVNAEKDVGVEGAQKKLKSDSDAKSNEGVGSGAGNDNDNVSSGGNDHVVGGNDNVSGENKSKENIEIIDLPSPMEGKRVITPLETVAYIMNMIENNPGKTYVRMYKDKLIEQQLIPIKKSQLNQLVKSYGGPGKPVAPLNWNERGARELGWEVLLTQFRDKQNRGMSWSINDTRDALNDVAMTTKKKTPTWETIESHHSSLIQLHNQQNHINEQIVIQERRLKEMPPIITVQKIEKTKGPPKPIKWNKNDKKYRKIKLPEPADGNMIYTPAETIAHIRNFAESDPTPPRTQVRAMKEKMIAEKLIPVSISQLNFLLSRHKGEDNPAPKCWNAKGREDIISMEELTQKVQDSHMMWRIENTCEILWENKKKISSRTSISRNPDDVKQPDKKTVNAYHTALLSIPTIAHKVVKPVVVKLKPGPKSKAQLAPNLM